MNRNSKKCDMHKESESYCSKNRLLTIRMRSLGLNAMSATANQYKSIGTGAVLGGI